MKNSYTLLRSISDVYFQGISILRKDSLVVPAALTQNHDNDIRSTIVFVWIKDHWSSFDIDEIVLSVASDIDESVFLCRNGDIYLADGSNVVKETSLGPGFSAVKKIGRFYYVCGSDARIAIRTSPGVWEKSTISTSQNSASKQPMIVDTAGTSPEDVWAVGLGGVVFHWDSTSWKLIDSPTNTHLYRVIPCGNKQALAAGKDGVILRLSQNKSEFIQTPTKELPAFWGLVLFDGIIYVSSYQGIYKVLNGKLEKDVFFNQQNIDTHFLDQAFGEMCSVGDTTINIYRDGVWTSIPHPLG